VTNRANSFVSNPKDVYKIRHPVRPGFCPARIVKSGVMPLKLTDLTCIKLVLEQRVNSLDFTSSFIFTFFLKKDMQDMA